MRLPGLKGEWAKPDTIEWARDQRGWVPTYTWTFKPEALVRCPPLSTIRLPRRRK